MLLNQAETQLSYPSEHRYIAMKLRRNHQNMVIMTRKWKVHILWVYYFDRSCQYFHTCCIYLFLSTVLSMFDYKNVFLVRQNQFFRQNMLSGENKKKIINECTLMGTEKRRRKVWTSIFFKKLLTSKFALENRITYEI